MALKVKAVTSRGGDKQNALRPRYGVQGLSIFSRDKKGCSIQWQDVDTLYVFSRRPVGLSGQIDGGIGLQGQYAQFQFRHAFWQSP